MRGAEACGAGLGGAGAWRAPTRSGGPAHRTPPPPDHASSNLNLAQPRPDPPIFPQAAHRGNCRRLHVIVGGAGRARARLRGPEADDVRPHCSGAAAASFEAKGTLLSCWGSPRAFPGASPHASSTATARLARSALMRLRLSGRRAGARAGAPSPTQLARPPRLSAQPRAQSNRSCSESASAPRRYLSCPRCSTPGWGASSRWRPLTCPSFLTARRCRRARCAAARAARRAGQDRRRALQGPGKSRWTAVGGRCQVAVGVAGHSIPRAMLVMLCMSAVHPQTTVHRFAPRPIRLAARTPDPVCPAPPALGPLA
jgi:hypothetical protein